MHPETRVLQKNQCYASYEEPQKKKTLFRCGREKVWRCIPHLMLSTIPWGKGTLTWLHYWLQRKINDWNDILQGIGIPKLQQIRKKKVVTDMREGEHCKKYPRDLINISKKGQNPIFSIYSLCGCYRRRDMFVCW